MPQQFDPYYIWLGIPPAEQPPHYYRLLGLSLFESHPLVISNSADRQMAHLRAMSTGPNGARAQQLLNEVAAARLCLLSVPKKADYDRDLRDWLQLREPIAGDPTAPAAPREPPRPVVARPVELDPAWFASALSERSQVEDPQTLPPRRPTWPVWLKLAAVGVLVIIALFTTLLVRSWLGT